MDLFGVHLSIAQFVVALACAFLAGFSKTGIVGLGIVITPLMASVFPAGLALGFLMPLFLAGDVISVIAFNRRVPYGALLRILPYGVAGTVGGWYFASYFQDILGEGYEQILRLTIGVLMAFVVGLSWYISKLMKTRKQVDATHGGGRKDAVNPIYTTRVLKL